MSTPNLRPKITIRVSPAAKAKWSAEARKNNQSLAQFIQRAVDLHMSGETKND